MLPTAYLCGTCEGEGSVWVQVGPEDSEQEQCSDCNASGIQIPEILFIPAGEMDEEDYPLDAEEEVLVNA